MYEIAVEFFVLVDMIMLFIVLVQAAVFLAIKLYRMQDPQYGKPAVFKVPEGAARVSIVSDMIGGGGGCSKKSDDAIEALRKAVDRQVKCASVHLLSGLKQNPKARKKFFKSLNAVVRKRIRSKKP